MASSYIAHVRARDTMAEGHAARRGADGAEEGDGHAAQLGREELSHDENRRSPEGTHVHAILPLEPVVRDHLHLGNTPLMAPYQRLAMSAYP